MSHAFQLMGNQLLDTIKTITQTPSPKKDSLPLPKIVPCIKKQFQVILEPEDNKYEFFHSLFLVQQLEDFSSFVFKKMYDE